jgi:hypothetical protein
LNLSRTQNQSKIVDGERKTYLNVEEERKAIKKQKSSRCNEKKKNHPIPYNVHQCGSHSEVIDEG